MIVPQILTRPPVVEVVSRFCSAVSGRSTRNQPAVPPAGRTENESELMENAILRRGEPFHDERVQGEPVRLSLLSVRLGHTLRLAITGSHEGSDTGQDGDHGRPILRTPLWERWRARSCGKRLRSRLSIERPGNAPLALRGARRFGQVRCRDAVLHPEYSGNLLAAHLSKGGSARAVQGTRPSPEEVDCGSTERPFAALDQDRIEDREPGDRHAVFRTSLPVCALKADHFSSTDSRSSGIERARIILKCHFDRFGPRCEHHPEQVRENLSLRAVPSLVKDPLPIGADGTARAIQFVCGALIGDA